MSEQNRHGSPDWPGGSKMRLIGKSRPVGKPDSTSQTDVFAVL